MICNLTQTLSELNYDTIILPVCSSLYIYTVAVES